MYVYMDMYTSVSILFIYIYTYEGLSHNHPEPHRDRATESFTVGKKSGIHWLRNLRLRKKSLRYTNSCWLNFILELNLISIHFLCGKIIRSEICDGFTSVFVASS